MLRSLNSFHKHLKVYVMPTEESTDIERHVTAAGAASSNDTNLHSSASLLDRQFNTVIPGSFIFYMVLQIAMGLEHEYSENPICSGADLSSHGWVHTTAAGTVACLLLTCVLQIVRIISLFSAKHWQRNLSLIRMNTLLLALIFISATAKILVFGWSFGGTCVDSFGVVSPAAQWAEWIVLVPLLQYAALAGEQKDALDRFDITMLLLLVAMLVFGFMLNLRLPLGVAVLFLLLSVLCLMLVTFMTYAFHRQVQQRVCSIKLRTSNYLAAKMTMRKDKLLIQLNIILWYYPLIYLLGMLRLLPPAYQIAGYLLGSMFGKVIFSSLVVESQITMLYEYLVNTSGKLQHISGAGAVADSYSIRDNWTSSKRTHRKCKTIRSSHIDERNSSSSRESSNENTFKSTASAIGSTELAAGTTNASATPSIAPLSDANVFPDICEEADEVASGVTLQNMQADENVLLTDRTFAGQT